jgi:3-phenylpropionate/cinnamic acid dioxygenase small subunit
MGGKKGGIMNLSTLRQEVEEFLYREAWLLDAYRLREWFDLLTEDVRYWIPTIESRSGTLERYREDGLYFHYVDWDRRLIDVRIRQFETGLNHCEIPPSVTQRLVSNVLVEPTEREDEIRAYSNIQVVQVRHGTHETIWRARREDRLRRVEGQWKLAERKVILLGAILPRTLAIFL